MTLCLCSLWRYSCVISQTLYRPCYRGSPYPITEDDLCPYSLWRYSCVLHGRFYKQGWSIFIVWLFHLYQELREELARQRTGVTTAFSMYDCNQLEQQIQQLQKENAELETTCNHYQTIAHDAYNQLKEIQTRGILSQSLDIQLKDWMDLMEEVGLCLEFYFLCHIIASSNTGCSIFIFFFFF